MSGWMRPSVIWPVLKPVRQKGLNFDEYWAKGSRTELYHFIGKDIINFHALFWPAMLSTAGYRTPTAVNAHGFVTVNGAKCRNRAALLSRRALF